MTNVLATAMSGLNDASLRLANAASNIANASSTSSLPASGGTYTGYQPQDVVTISSGTGAGVTSTLQARSPAYRAAADPGSPNANANGLVAAPNVDPTSDIIASGVAQASYGANAAVIRTADQMQKSLLNILS